MEAPHFLRHRGYCLMVAGSDVLERPTPREEGRYPPPPPSSPSNV